MEQENNKNLVHRYDKAAEIIKTAILRCQYVALSQINAVQLSLYFSIGRYISQNSREGFWGTGALRHISEKLIKDLPGLRGFSEPSLRKMRIFYEEWSKSFVVTNDLPAKSSEQNILLEIRSLQRMNFDDFDFGNFIKVPFTHHYTILSKEKRIEARKYYIALCAREFLSDKSLAKAIAEDDYGHQGQLPNNFEREITTSNFARKAVMSFKDEYMLDFINTEQIGERDAEDVDERVVEQQIVHNIKNFILKFGHDFAFMGNQFRIDAFGESHYIDLLFYNRELSCLVAVELKTGKLKSAFLGQLRDYLALLDDFVKKPNENQSIGIILCKDMDRNRAEYLVRQYDKPMGIATYKTRADMPERLRNALPDIEELKKLL